jgi:hypothetical protein
MVWPYRCRGRCDEAQKQQIDLSRAQRLKVGTGQLTVCLEMEVGHHRYPDHLPLPFPRRLGSH